MPTRYTKRGFEILREKGPLEFFRKVWGFFLWNLLLSRYEKFKFQIFCNHLMNLIKYDAPRNPAETIMIKPSEVNYKLKQDNDGEYVIPTISIGGIGQIINGGWDSVDYRESVKDVWVIKGFREHFVEKKDWEDTEYYKYCWENYKDTDKYKRDGFEDFEQYLTNRCENYDELFYEIKNNGYQPGHIGRNRYGASKSYIDNLEVLVTIDRNGNINLWEGHHRFAIARILDLEIPAHVVCRHKQWQELRDEIYNKGISEEDGNELRNHPDLQDILE